MGDETAWNVSDSRVIVRDKWISLRADDCVTPSGVVVAPYYVQPTADPSPDEAEDIAVSLLPVGEFHPGMLGQGYHRLNAYMADEQLGSRPTS